MPLHPVVERMWLRQQQAGISAFSSLSVDEARRAFSSTRDALGHGPAMACISERVISGPGGDIPCRLYVPEGPLVGLCVYFHGGGWVLGALDDFDALVRALAKRSSCAVLSVDYRLAPEHPFPAALDDAQTAIEWAATKGLAELGLRHGLVLAGDSAGGNLAAVSALQWSAADVRLQVLFNPCVDASFDTASYRAYGDGYLLTEDDMRWFLAHYEPSAAWLQPRIAPLRASSFDRAPPAWIGVAEFDILRDEGVAYAERLRAAGRSVALHCYAGMMHGYARLFNLVDCADRAVDDAAAAIRGAFATDL